MENTELEDLDQLVNSAGWRRFADYIASEWGTDEGGGQRFKQNAKNAADNIEDAMALSKLRQIMAAQREIHRLLAWVDERVAYLKKTQLAPDSDATPMSRRGGL